MNIRLIYDDEQFVRKEIELNLPRDMTVEMLHKELPELCREYFGMYDENCYFEIITDYNEYKVKLEEGSWGY